MSTPIGLSVLRSSGRTCWGLPSYRRWSPPLIYKAPLFGSVASDYQQADTLTIGIGLGKSLRPKG